MSGIPVASIHLKETPKISQLEFIHQVIENIQSQTIHLANEILPLKTEGGISNNEVSYYEILIFYIF